MRPATLVRRWRMPLILAVVLLAAVLAGLLLVRPSGTGRLDPSNPGPDGSRALVQVLRDHGVDVRMRHRFTDVEDDAHSAPGRTTIMLARPDRLPPGRAGELAYLLRVTGTDLVVVGADNGLLSDLRLPLGARSIGDTKIVDPECPAALPRRAGDAVSGSITYSAVESGGDEPMRLVGCYPVQGQPTYVEAERRDGRRTTILGGGDLLTNDRLSDAGDAALAVGVLGRHPKVIWWTPDPLDGTVNADGPSLNELIPGGVRFATLQLLVVLIVVVLWRGRRLGRLVPEPLPVIVRAVETTMGRAQLYRRGRARGRAAQVLRAATLRRLATRCGLPHAAAVDEVSAAVAAATGRSPTDVATLVVGADPPTDTALVQLATDLDALEGEVYRS